MWCYVELVLYRVFWRCVILALCYFGDILSSVWNVVIWKLITARSSVMLCTTGSVSCIFASCYFGDILSLVWNVVIWKLITTRSSVMLSRTGSVSCILASCYFGDTLSPVWNVVIWKLITTRSSVMVCRTGPVSCVSSWCTYLLLFTYCSHSLRHFSDGFGGRLWYCGYLKGTNCYFIVTPC